ncbi:MAG: glycoside hydrolase family 2 protein [Pseudobutyrivibrio sp.]|nr:glycoside hydrolase family 2 protein [Pseudobutyrivibrio sp.]
MAQRIYCNRKWRFIEHFDMSMVKEQVLLGCSIVDIPHTVKETPYSYFDEHVYQMECCYQKSLFVPKQWEGMVVELVFEAIGHESDIYVNGNHVKHHTCGYTAIRTDVSEVLVYGQDNLITVRVDTNEDINQPPFGFVIDYMTFGGIYRDVYFEVKNRLNIADVFCKPSLLEKISTRNKTASQIKQINAQAILKTDCYLSNEVFEAAVEERVFIKQYLDQELLLSQPVGGLEAIDNTQLLRITSAPLSVQLWDVVNPRVYVVKTDLYLDDELVDSNETTVGFRRSEFLQDGYYLNGRKLKIRGLNRHQSYPYVGYAMPESMQRYDAKILKDELCVNAVRTSHYPQSQYFIDECDRTGLLVFTEIPGWQYIGGDEWKDIAVANTKDMVCQYRNHPSIILWGVRINESKDDDDFYIRTNEVAHKYDPTRPTGGVRCIANSNLFEDVYTYNDFIHSGDNEGCQPKKKITSDINKPYLISEYNGHMFPTKLFDCEEHRREHAMRHAKVLDSVAAQSDIAGSFGWCMFDYNTHKDFGAGDRICYHGVMDMFRNPKLAAYVYAAQGDMEPVLEISSTFDIGEHPACNRGDTYIISNADQVRMYKNDKLIKEYIPEDSSYKHLKHGPILIDDFIGDAILEGENFKPRQAALVKEMMNIVACKGMKMTPRLAAIALQLVFIYHMDPKSAVPLYNKYVGDWGGEAKVYRFEAIKNNEVVKEVTKSAMTEVHIRPIVSQTLLTELHSYDVAQVRLLACDDYDNQLFFYNEPVQFEVEGPIELIGPSTSAFRGGATGVYIKSKGEDGDGRLIIKCGDMKPMAICFSVESLSK